MSTNNYIQLRLVAWELFTYYLMPWIIKSRTSLSNREANKWIGSVNTTPGSLHNPIDTKVHHSVVVYGGIQILTTILHTIYRCTDQSCKLYTTNAIYYATFKLMKKWCVWSWYSWHFVGFVDRCLKKTPTNLFFISIVSTGVGSFWVLTDSF